MRQRTPWLAIALVAPALLLAACSHARRPPQAWREWQTRRMEDVGGPRGWAALAGLHWLEPGRHPIGSDTQAVVRLPPGAAPGLVGTIVVAQGIATFEPAPLDASRIQGRPLPDRAAVQLHPDIPGPPTIVESGRLQWWLLSRAGRLGVRVRDPEGPGRKAFAGIRTFPYNPALRIEARFVPFPAPQGVTVQDVAGNTSRETAPGLLVFELDGKSLQLTPVEDAEAKDWFINFRDATSGHGTYPGGRFLHVPVAGPDGRVILDFNFAYNPPCAFTPHATCPVPPRSNGLPVPVRAGERFDGHGPRARP